MKKYFLLMLVSGILLGANEKELTIEKILNNENVVAAATASAKQSTAKKEEKKAAAVPKKTVNTATNNKAATPQNNAKTTANENVKAKQTNEVKKTATTKSSGAVSPQKDTANTVIDRDRTKQFNDPKNLEKGSYCNKPVGRHQFQEINDKGEYRADIKFQYCMINNEEKENMTVGIIGTDLNAISGYIKKYAYLHLKNADKLHQNTDGKSYYYDGVWAWSNSSDYPMSAWEEKTNTNKGK